MILQQIKNDIAYLKKLIPTITSDVTTFTRNDVLLSGNELEETLEKARATQTFELEKLELILELGIIPDRYYSSITNQTHYPSKKELELKSRPLPPAKHTYFGKKTSRKAIHVENSYLRVLNDKTNQVAGFFVEHNNVKNYPNGGFAEKIKKGFITPDCRVPKYAVKVYKKDKLSDTGHELRVAIRAAYCYKQLGRESYAFRRNNKQYLVTEWLPGENLCFANQKQIQSIPVPERIIMATSLLRELNILHKSGLIHGDIKPENVMISTGKLNLVDMDSVKPKNEKKLHDYDRFPMYTKRYLPSAQMSYDAIYNTDHCLKFDENTDLYAMGITLIHLFQDVYIPIEESIVINVEGGPVHSHTFETFSILHGPDYAKHPELQRLLNNMVFQEQANIKTAEDYIDEMENILSKYPGYEQHITKDRPEALESDLSAEDGVNAFKEIEVELSEYNNRLNVMNKKRTLRELLPQERNKYSWTTYGLFSAAVVAATAAIGVSLNSVASPK